MLRLLAPLALSLSLTCQQTLVVDQATGPFTTIGAAVAAAVSGDRIEVHPGNYAGFSVSIGVDIVAPLGGVFVGGHTSVPSFSGERITIVNVPAADSLRLDGIALTPNPVIWGSGVDADSTFYILNCAGAVHLHQVSSTANGPWDGGTTNVVQSSPRVAFSNCSFSGMVLANSSATFSACTVQGTHGRTTTNQGWPGQDGLALNQSRVFLSDCTIAGGGGGSSLNFGLPGAPGGFGVSGDSASSLVAVGQGSLVGGWDGSFGTVPHEEPALTLAPANARLGPNIAVTPAQPVTRIADPPQIVAPLALPRGTSVAIQVGNAANQTVLLGIDTAHDLIRIPGIELPFVLTTAASLYAFAPPSPTSPTPFSLFVPPAPWLANVFVYWQAVGVAGDGTLQSSTGGYGRIQ
jgi:hypothetical protein